MAKYAANAFHAAKACSPTRSLTFSHAAGVDGRRVMDLLVQDARLNISPAYLRPGFAYGGSCLPKDVRALLHAARQRDVELPLPAKRAPEQRAAAPAGDRPRACAARQARRRARPQLQGGNRRPAREPRRAARRGARRQGLRRPDLRRRRQPRARARHEPRLHRSGRAPSRRPDGGRRRAAPGLLRHGRDRKRRPASSAASSTVSTRTPSSIWSACRSPTASARPSASATSASPGEPVRVLVISQLFAPEMGALPNRLSPLTRHLGAHGHDVYVATGMPNYPRGEVFRLTAAGASCARSSRARVVLADHIIHNSAQRLEGIAVAQLFELPAGRAVQRLARGTGRRGLRHLAADLPGAAGDRAGQAAAREAARRPARSLARRG